MPKIFTNWYLRSHGRYHVVFLAMSIILCEKFKTTEEMSHVIVALVIC